MKTEDDAVQVLANHQEIKQAELGELLRTYNVIDANYDPHGGSYVVLSERVPNVVAGMGFPEMGFIDPSPFTAWTRLEHVPELRERRGIRTFYDMRRNDGAVRAALRIIKTSIQGAEWYIEPAGESTTDQNIAKFVEKNLFEDLEVPWQYFIEDCCLSIDYGYFTFEKVYQLDMTDKKIKLQRLTPLHPLDIQDWTYASDGELTGLRLEPLYGTDYTKMPIEIPLNKLLHITFEREGGDLRGLSILRSAFKHWYYKDTLYKIDAIQKERHGIGIPVIKLPVGFTPEDKVIAQDLGRNLRTNERAYIAAPANWEIYFAKLEGQPVDPIPSIEHHDKKIYESVLAAFMGSRDVSKESLDTFYKSTRYVAEGCIAAAINRGLIRELVDINFLRKGSGYPKLRVRRMGEWEDTRTMTFAMRNLVGAKLLRPDENLENLLRAQMGLPKYDPDKAIEMEPKGGLIPPGQNVKPPKVDGSRQKGTPPVSTPAKNSGTDRSGG